MQKVTREYWKVMRGKEVGHMVQGFEFRLEPAGGWGGQDGASKGLLVPESGTRPQLPLWIPLSNELESLFWCWIANLLHLGVRNPQGLYPGPPLRAD